MQTPEQRLWTWLDRQMGSAWFAQRIESTGTAPGIPDVYFSSPVRDLRGWIELKSISGWGPTGQPLTVSTWRPEQRNWMQLHRAAGGRSWLVVEVRETTEVCVFSDAFALDGLRQFDCDTVRRSLRVINKRNADARALLDALATQW